MLGIAWSSHPLPSNHTAPGCMLRFDVRGVGHESSVTVSFTYADVTSPDPVAVRMGTTFFTDTHHASKVGALESFDALLCPLALNLMYGFSSHSTRFWTRPALSSTCHVSIFPRTHEYAVSQSWCNLFLHPFKLSIFLI